MTKVDRRTDPNLELAITTKKSEQPQRRSQIVPLVAPAALVGETFDFVVFGFPAAGKCILVLYIMLRMQAGHG